MIPVHNSAHKFHNGKPTIGVLAGWQFYRTATNLSYLAPLYRGISRAAQDLGCNLVLGCGIGPTASHSDPLRPAWPIASPDVDFVPIGPYNTDGLLIANPLHAQERSDYVQLLKSNGHPILFIGAGETGPTIAADNAGGIQEAMQHLFGHGHRRIAFIAGSPSDLNGDSGDRLSAYQAFLSQYQLEPDPQLIVYGRHVYDGGYSAMQQIMKAGTPFTAVLASNDESALGAMRALEEARCKIPKEVAIIGFDNRLEGAVHEPGLSSVHVPLFNMGYRALQRLFEHITQKTALDDAIKIETHLVTRTSCGCGVNALPAAPSTKAQIVSAMVASVSSQTYHFTDDECRLLCQQLVESFDISLWQNNTVPFHATLDAVLQQTATYDDDAHIWQEALSMLGATYTTHALINPMLDAARLQVSAAMKRQYRNYVLNERWIASRLSLLTDRLLGSLDEAEIYEILARHLPELNIRTALVALFETESNNPQAVINIRDVVHPEQPPLKIPACEFPPQSLFADAYPVRLTLIPLMSHAGQMGFVAFGVEQLDLYGAIVQQLGGALNTARLYREANEGRKLAEEANRMKSRFLSTISHELRTPLNLIIGLNGIILQENEEDNSPLPVQVQRDLERIQVYAQHLGGLIGDVLDLATSEAGQLRLNKSLVNLGETLRMVSESGRQMALDKGLAWSASMPENGPWVWGDPTRLRQVALNLVNNAVKFTTQGGITLKVAEDHGNVTVYVKDTGLGIPVEDQDLIFSEFTRSERSVQLGYQGMGLGLAICKRLIEMHAGVIEVRSTGVAGDGSTFHFTLPTVQPSADQIEEMKQRDLLRTSEFGKLPTTGQLTRGEEKNLTILVVDDDPNTLDLHARIIQSHSLSNRVLQARNGRAALDLLAREPVDLVLLDLHMPEMDGFQVLETMQKEERMQKIPVIVVTGQVLTEAEMARLNRGVASILEKGLFGLDETVAHIAAALEHKRRLSGEAQRLVRKAMAFIHEKYAEPLSRRDIAKHISIAEDYLTFCFRQELKTTPIKYLQRYRINRAKALLKETQYSITEIARLVGFADSGYFSRIFHREAGVAPDEFRRS